MQPCSQFAAQQVAGPLRWQPSHGQRDSACSWWQEETRGKEGAPTGQKSFGGRNFRVCRADPTGDGWVELQQRGRREGGGTGQGWGRACQYVRGLPCLCQDLCGKARPADTGQEGWRAVR